jgi:ABC-type lipoprotein export system ATPase subunit
MIDAAFARKVVSVLVAEQPCIGEFLASLGLGAPPVDATLGDWLAGLSDEAVADAGMERDHILGHVQGLSKEVRAMRAAAEERVESLTILGGRNKLGEAEHVTLTIRAGEIVCIVGPTGSGKSRLLGDIESLAQGDTPTGRRVLVNGRVAAEDRRFAVDRKLVAQLSQNMNFVVDLSVEEFVEMHAHCRMGVHQGDVVARVIACANDLTGEKFAKDISVTQLSGGQTRALMIADVALLSASPVVLIDEIENAGVDRKQALELLVSKDKIVLISTHDPLLALRGGRRIVIRNGGIAEVIETSEAELRTLRGLEEIDAKLMDIRDRLRGGQRVEAEIAW